MPKYGIVGCGFTGVRLARLLKARGHEVVASRRNVSGLARLESEGIQVRSVDLASGSGLHELDACDGLIHLAPTPETDEAIEKEVRRLGAHFAGRTLVYGSTTGAFGRQPEGAWVDERSPTGPLQDRGARRKAYEVQLQAAEVELRIVRIAGIYGPGRSMFDSLKRGIVLFEGGPPTSRIHVEDLARLLAASLDPNAPALVVGCDREPAPTLEVARFACQLSGQPLPPIDSIEEAARRMSPLAKELRLSGRRCRSVVRDDLIGSLRYPTYREGLEAIWAASRPPSPQA
ncbi:MAG: NAD-dependent epimerase/dehydratase family protein [Myxococcota bacterium]